MTEQEGGSRREDLGTRNGTKKVQAQAKGGTEETGETFVQNAIAATPSCPRVPPVLTAERCPAGRSGGGGYNRPGSGIQHLHLEKSQSDKKRGTRPQPGRGHGPPGVSGIPSLSRIFFSTPEGCCPPRCCANPVPWNPQPTPAWAQPPPGRGCHGASPVRRKHAQRPALFLHFSEQAAPAKNNLRGAEVCKKHPPTPHTPLPASVQGAMPAPGAAFAGAIPQTNTHTPAPLPTHTHTLHGQPREDTRVVQGRPAGVARCCCRTLLLLLLLLHGGRAPRRAARTRICRHAGGAPRAPPALPSPSFFGPAAAARRPSLPARGGGGSEVR